MSRDRGVTGGTSIRRFGEKLRGLRQGRGLTLKQMAGVLGMRAHGYLSEIERGKKKPSVELVVRAAEYFGVSTDGLLRDCLEVGVREDGGRKGAKE